MKKEDLDNQDIVNQHHEPQHNIRVAGLMPSLANRTRSAFHHHRATENRKPGQHFAFMKRLFHLIKYYRVPYYAAWVVGVLFALQVILFGTNLLRGIQPILGLRFHGQDVTNYNRSRLVTLINQAIQDVERSPLIVQAGASRTKLTARQLGARYSTNALVAGLYSAGHSGSLWSQLVAQDAAVLGQLSFRLGFPDINEALTRDYLDKVNAASKKAPVNAGLAFVGDRVTITPEQPGYEVDVDKSILTLKKYDQSLDMNLIRLPLKKVAADLSYKAVHSLLPEVKRITDKPLTVKAGQQQATVSRSALTNMLAVENTPDPRHPTRNKPSLVIDQQDSDKVSVQLVRQFSQDAIAQIVNGKTTVSAGQDGVSLSGSQTKVSLLTHMLMRQQQMIDSDKPLNLATHAIKAPVLPKNPDANYYGGMLSAYSGNSPRVTLSFEGMPNATYGPQILDILKRNNVRAVFFNVGRNASSYPDVVKRMSDEGHIAGVSTYSYRDVADLTGSNLSDEITQSKAIVAKITNKQPTLFRSPYGSSNSAADGVLLQAHLDTLNWTLDALDWANLPASFITNRVLNGARAGSIIMLHTQNNQTIEALPQIIDGLKKKGFVLS
jgi:peptidoglycan/xylan/chitin deacetylase (PgdA/CDA1 family)